MSAVLQAGFFDRPSLEVARDLLGKVLRRRWRGRWLAAAVVEAEAYSIQEKGSHASLGRTPSREALFMPPGTIYMYYSRAGDSLNVSCRGEGDAVLVKSARVYVDALSPQASVRCMQKNNPLGERMRPVERLCSGQTLLCRALALRVGDWNERGFDPRRFYLEDTGYRPAVWVQARRLGIPRGRDEHLLWRFIDGEHLAQATENPARKRGAREGVDYLLHRRKV